MSLATLKPGQPCARASRILLKKLSMKSLGRTGQNTASKLTVRHPGSTCLFDPEGNPERCVWHAHKEQSFIRKWKFEHVHMGLSLSRDPDCCTTSIRLLEAYWKLNRHDRTYVQTAQELSTFHVWNNEDNINSNGGAGNGMYRETRNDTMHFREQTIRDFSTEPPRNK